MPERKNAAYIAGTASRSNTNRAVMRRQEPDKSTDFYLRQDPESQAEYQRYLSNRAPNDSSKAERSYSFKEAGKHESSIKGHNDQTKKMVDELNKRLSERDNKKR